MTGQGFFVSDLHLFTRRSHGERHTADIHRAASRASQFVLGGDIFDFHWTKLPSVADTLDEAIRWIDNLVAPHPQCEFHFILGNHDFHEGFMERLDRYGRRRANFAWHRYYLRDQHNVFLHGDVADRPTSQQSLAEARVRGSADQKHGPWRNIVYDLAVGARIHKLASAMVHRKPLIAQRIVSYLEDIGHGPESGLKNVYFGHTHAPMHEYEFSGLRFHNPGAPIKGLDFRIVPIETAAQGPDRCRQSS